MTITAALFWMLVVLAIPGVMIGAFGVWAILQWIRIRWIDGERL